MPETQVEGQEEECGHVTSDGNGAGLSDAALYAWAESMFAGGSDASVALGGEPVCETPTVGLCIRCKAAVIKLYMQCASNVCRSPERPDLRLSKEEAQGHLMGNLVLGELLESEARRIGKDIDNVCAKEEAAKKQAAKDAKEARRKARQAVADPAAAAQAAAVVDTAVERACAERLCALVVLPNLPPRSSVIVPMPAPCANRRKPSKVSKIIATPKDNLERLEEQAAAMEASIPRAEAARMKAKRARERAQGEREQALKRVRKACASASDDTFAVLQSEYAQSAANVVRLMQA